MNRTVIQPHYWYSKSMGLMKAYNLFNVVLMETWVLCSKQEGLAEISVFMSMLLMLVYGFHSPW